MYITACDVTTFAKSLWSAVINGVCKGIYVTTRLRPLINCRINKGRTSNRKRNFLMDSVCLNNILIQILKLLLKSIYTMQFFTYNCQLHLHCISGASINQLLHLQQCAAYVNRNIIFTIFCLIGFILTKFNQKVPMFSLFTLESERCNNRYETRCTT